MTYLDNDQFNPYEYQLINGLKISLSIRENPYQIPLDKLFSLATRQNLKRSFLFVSKLLGKHIPIDPKIHQLAGRALGLRMLDKLYKQKEAAQIDMVSQALRGETKDLYHLSEQSLSLPEPMTFIGFAETATALGYGMFDSFAGDSAFIHTTREELPDLRDRIIFSEEHSHASRHYIYLTKPEIFAPHRTVVLVDDELTTGKTALNIITAMQKRFPRKKYIVATILDWRSEENHQALCELEKTLGVTIEVISLLKGAYRLSGSVQRELPDRIGKQAMAIDINSSVKINYYRLDEYFKESLAYPSAGKVDQQNQNPYLLETGRFGISAHIRPKLHQTLKTLGEALSKTRKGSRTLCLGTGEFIYLPMVISAWMGEGVKYHSTTRSPIYPCNEANYGIKNAFEFMSPEDTGLKNYLYNIPQGTYDEIYLFLERQVKPGALQSLLLILGKLADHINVVYFTGENEMPDIGSYSREDVIFLLKDISHIMVERDTQYRERAIQSGVHYSEMLPVEYVPSREYVDLFHQSLGESGLKLAVAAGIVAEKILRNRGKDIVLVSLARAGTPIGILIKRYIQQRYQMALPHYSISIIREKGIDLNAIKHIIKYHPGMELQFIDGWTGKGVIARVLMDSCHELREHYDIDLDPGLAVLADPGHCTQIYGSREDFLIPSACLNATVSGLVSRTVHRTDIIQPEDFHGAKFYRELAAEDLSNLFIDQVTAYFTEAYRAIDEALLQWQEPEPEPTWKGLRDIEEIQRDFHIDDINLIKPGIGETTRVLLRRVPWKILIKNENDRNLRHIILLAQEKQVPIERYPSMAYGCCGIIKPMGGGAE
ncbi:phosphoribosyltransferase [Alkaliphilus crotonatoxidans]